jgi:hypothetical protein
MSPPRVRPDQTTSNRPLTVDQQLEAERRTVAVLRRDLDAARARITALEAARDVAVRVGTWGARLRETRLE